jgi:ABC-type multidrug transport system fused ATPase/permease subunit
MTMQRGRFADKGLLRKILHRVRPHAGLAGGATLVLVLGAMVGLLTPWPLKILVDSVLGDAPPPAFLAGLLPDGDGKHALLLIAVLGGLGITVVNNSLSVAHNYFGTRLKERLVLDFRSDLFQHVQRLSLSFHDQHRTGDLMNRITYQSGAIGAAVLAGPPLLQGVVTLAGMFWIAYSLDPTLALLSLSVVPFIYYSVGFYSRYVDPRLREVRGMESQMMTIVHEAMAMLRVIVTFGRESHEYQRFREHGERAIEARVRVTVDQTVFSMVVNTCTALGTALVLGFGAYQVLQARLTVGELLVIMSYIGSVYTPLQAISTTAGTLKDQLISTQMAFELLDMDPEIKDAPNAVRLERSQGHIVFDRVSFSYPSRQDTLKNICLEALPGQVIAIVGQTGAGKSTLASLIPRLYDPTEGRVLIDGHDIRTVSLASLRGQVSVVLQEPLLFSTTIAENIRYGRLDASDEEVIASAKAANAHDFIMRLPDQYNTMLGERGARLSGGERQRISVARAFLRNAPILILDEPTSSIDSRTEGVILDALDRLVVGRTTFIIAHRLSTIRQADQILVLDRGEIVERGTYRELMMRNGHFRQLHDAQMRAAAHRKSDLLVAEELS